MITLLIHNSQLFKRRSHQYVIIMITGVAMIYLNVQANTSTRKYINS